MASNLTTFFETSKEVRGGKFVWWKDGNGENRRGVLLGSTIANPTKGFGHLYAAQLFEYKMGEEGLIFRSFEVKSGTGTSIVLNGDGYSDMPEIGMLLMVAPDAAATKGQSSKVTAVDYDAAKKEITVTLDTSLTTETGDILVEAKGSAASPTATVLVANPNTFIEADEDLLPTEGYGMTNVSHQISTVWDKMAFISRMQPLPKYVLAKNRSYIDGVFWI